MNRRDVLRAKNKLRYLLKEQDITGIGIGQDNRGVYFISVYLARKNPELLEKIPKEENGIPVQTKVIGKMRFLEESKKGVNSPKSNNYLQKRQGGKKSLNSQ